MERRLDKTKKGRPALWESGGGATNTGFAEIIAGPGGERLTPIYVARGGHLSCKQHALFEARPLSTLIIVSHSHEDFSIQVHRIERIEKREEFYAELTLLHAFSEGQWNVDPPEYLTAAIDAAKEKATCYHCRSPHFTL